MPLASLRLTAALLFLAVLMTWVATMEQAFDDVFNVKMRHFGGLLVEIPIQTFFPPAWFPQQQSIPGSLVLPSGLSILILMIVNLTAAHSLRFKIQASGTRLAAGFMALVAAIGVTFAVIANGHSAGVQTEPLISYAKMWQALPFFLLITSIASIAWSFSQDKKKKSQKAFLWYLGSLGVMAGLVLLFFNKTTYIGDSAMRIMWQLIQATVAAIAGYIACLLLFKRKAGMVLLHLGVMGLMVNEIVVTTMHKEQRLTVAEGETTSHVIDIRFFEMAIVDTSDPSKDRIVNIPDSKLRTGERVSSPELPFDVQCIQYLQNSDIGAVPPNNPATAGIGLRMAAIELPSVAGTDSDQAADFGAAYVKLFKKGTEESLGTYLLASQLKTELADSVEVNGIDFRILLRFETEYKPYEVTLNDANYEFYPGTKTPKNYESKVTIKHLESGETTDQKIFMNNPLRYSGETFYQSGMPEPDPGQTQISVLQVVTNMGWMIPYVCCMFTVVGLFSQFGQSMTSHLNKQSQRQSPARKAIYWLPALAIVGILAAYFLSSAFRAAPVVEKDGMRLDLLGKVPVTYQGRVQPLDSFARNTLRQIRTVETVDDLNNDRQPAIRWLADLMFDSPESGAFRTFYMTDPNVKNALKLPSPRLKDIKRKKYVYTIDEVFSSAEEMMELIPDRKQIPEEKWTPLQRNIEMLRRQLVRLSGVKSIFGPPDQSNLLDQAGIMADTRGSQLTPYVVPQDDPNKPWESLTVAGGPAWIKSIAKGASTIEAITELEEIEELLVERSLRRVAMQSKFRGQDVSKILDDREQRKAMWNLLDSESRENLLARERKSLQFRLQIINNGNNEVIESVPPNVELLQRLKPAYLAKDAETFNGTLNSYLASIEKKPPTFFSSWGNQLELLFNRFSPFYLATVLYIAAFIFVGLAWAGFGWTGWRLSVGRTAVGLLLLAVVIHAVGIGMRVGISGRPPVTNLYSSVLFVTWAGVLIALLLELFTRQGIGSMLGCITGVGGLIWAQSMANIDGDTFTVMVAVLDTTFWLATHVIMISLGYAATFMAGLVGIVFLTAHFATWWLNDDRQRRLFANILYGIVCFGLLASFFGTVLGGLWGDDSWGRFWGWDPKENGALMIVLWNALILHARWGGMIKDRGVAALAILGNVIVLWSWKGVNALGVGLHAYAASEDKSLKWIVLVAVLHLVVACLALLPGKIQLFPEK